MEEGKEISTLNMEIAMGKMTNGKVTEEDEEISIKTIKAGGTEGNQWLHKVIRQLWKREYVDLHLIILLAESHTSKIREPYYHYCWQSHLPADAFYYNNPIQHDNVYIVYYCIKYCRSPKHQSMKTSEKKSDFFILRI